jgi:hypothetical protein
MADPTITIMSEMVDSSIHFISYYQQTLNIYLEFHRNWSDDSCISLAYLLNKIWEYMNEKILYLKQQLQYLLLLFMFFIYINLIILLFRTFMKFYIQYSCFCFYHNAYNFCHKIMCIWNYDFLYDRNLMIRKTNNFLWCYHYM